MNAQVKRWTTGLATLVIVLSVTLMTLGAMPWNSSANPLAPNADETEPNNTFGEANSISIAEIVFGAIPTADDLDYFVMTTSVGTNYQVVLNPLQGRRREIQIYDETLTRIATEQTGTTTEATVQFVAQYTTYYFLITVDSDVPSTNGQPDYRFQVDYNTPTPTNTATHTLTPTPTQTPMPTPANIPGETEVNDAPNTADSLAVPGRIFGAITNIYDTDCFVIDVTIGMQYRIILQDYGFNRWLRIYDHNGFYTGIGNTTATNHQLETTLQASDTRYYLCIEAVTEASPSNALVDYLLEVIILQPTATATNTFTPTPTRTSTPSSPTNTPKATWPSGYDDYEPNYNFALATTIAPGLNYDLNFMPWGGATVDNDYLKIRVKPGLQLTCETNDLDPGVDPRMAFYSGPGEGYFMMANDDIALGDFNSRLSYYASYEGFLYILVGQGDRMDIRDAAQSAYSIKCELGVPGAQATPAAGKGDYTPPATTPSPTKTPQTPVSPIATPTQPPEAEGESRELEFRLVTTPPPPTRPPAATGYRTFRVMVYYDANNDGLPGAGEGVPGFFATVHSPETKAELARGYTDDQGQISFTVSTVGTVRVLIPLLGFDRLIEATKPEVDVRIAPPSLPVSIP